MTLRVWGKSLLTALGVGALAGAGQLGLAYGLGIIVWRQDYQTGSANAWYAQLAWVCAVAVMAVLAGTTAGAFMLRRLAHDPAELAREGLRPDDIDEAGATPITGREVSVKTVLAVAAVVGALIVLPLAMLPAREARPLGVGHPADAVQVVAVWGLIIGVVAATLSHLFRPVGWSIAGAAGWLWLAGLIASIRDISKNTTGTGERLGVPLTPAGAHAAGNTLVLLTLLGVGLVLGVSVAIAAAQRREAPALVIAAGVSGPVLIMLMYLVAGKGVHTTGQSATDHLVPYRSTPFAALLALFGAVFVAIMTQRRPNRRRPITAGATTTVRPAVGAPHHGASHAAGDWRTTTQTQPALSRPMSPAPVSPAPVSAAPVSVAPVSVAPVSSPPSAPAPPRPSFSSAAASTASDEWPGGRGGDEWPGGKGTGAAAPGREDRSSRKERKAARRATDVAATSASDWLGGRAESRPTAPAPWDSPASASEPARMPAQTRAAEPAEPPRIYAVPSTPAVAQAAPAPARPAEPARSKRGIFRRSSTAETRPSPNPPPVSLVPPSAPTPAPPPAASAIRDSGGGLFRRSDKAESSTESRGASAPATIEPTTPQRFSTARPARPPVRPAAEKSSGGSLFTPVEPVHTRSRSGLFSHTDAHPTVPPAPAARPATPAAAPEPPKAGRTVPTQASPSRSEAAARSARSEPPIPPASPSKPAATDPSLSRRKAKKAEKVAREQARVDHERQRHDDEFSSWLGEIAPPKLPAGRRRQINDEDDDDI